MRVSTITAIVSLIFAASFVAGCAGSAGDTNPVPNAAGASLAKGRTSGNLHLPALITLDTATGSLEYWPIQPGSSGSPQQISSPLGVANALGMVGNGNLIAMTNYNPNEVVTYDVQSQVEDVRADPFGEPIDLAIGTNQSLYVLHVDGSVTAYRAPGLQPSRLTCQYVTDGVAIAADNENDIFVNGYGPNGFIGIVEYPFGKRICAALHLRAEKGYAGGVGVDPKTDDLLVVDNPDFCAGGLEGRMLVYTKPYGPKTGKFHNLKSNYCAGTVRLDAKSENIFVSDATISAGFPIVDQLTYPESRPVATYSGGYFGGFTTIPNTLPN